MLSLIKISYRVLSLESRVANSSVCVLYSRSRSNILYCAGYTGKYTDASRVRYCTKRTQEYCEGYTSCQAYLWGINLTVGPLYVSWSLTVQYDYSTVQINMQINDLLTSGKDPYIMTPSVYPPILWKTSEKYPKYCCFYRKIRGNPRNSLQVEEIKSTEIGNFYLLWLKTWRIYIRNLADLRIFQWFTRFLSPAIFCTISWEPTWFFEKGIAFTYLSLRLIGNDIVLLQLSIGTI